MAEQEKYILLKHLKKLALKERADYIALIAQALGEDILPGVTVTLPVNGWTEKTQRVLNESFLADGHYWYLVCADADCLWPYLDAGIMAKNVTVTGEMSFSCANVPEEDLTVNIIRLEVNNKNEQS